MENVSVLKTFNEEDLYESTVWLKESINLRDLTLTDSKGGVDFEVESDSACLSEDLPEYHKENVHKVIPLESLGFEEDDSESSAKNDDLESPFEKLSKTMECLTEDGGVRKKILQQGIGERVPPNVEITIHYSASLEYSDEPFDSTRLRERPFKYVLGCGEMIPGLECGIATMKKGEESFFLVSPDYAFGKRGVPPRIPGSATILFRVELLKWAETTEVQKYFQMAWEDRRVCEFELLRKVAEHFIQEGKTDYLQKKYISAVQKFTRGIRAIEEYRPANEQVENEFHKLLIRLCQNACVVNMKLNKFNAVKYYADKALIIDPKSTKALFQMGKAQRHCGDFDRALATLRKALELEPKNKAIASELAIVNRYKAAMDFSYSDMCRKMFGENIAKKSEKDSRHKATNNRKLQSDLTELLESRLKNFIDSDVMELPLPSSSFTEVERDFIKKFCSDNNLDYVEKGKGSNHHIRLCKRKLD